MNRFSARHTTNEPVRRRATPACSPSESNVEKQDQAVGVHQRLQVGEQRLDVRDVLEDLERGDQIEAPHVGDLGVLVDEWVI